MSDRLDINPLNNMHLHTEFLESCDWDEEQCDKLLVSVSEIFQSLEINKPQIVLFGFEKWFELKVVSKFMDIGLNEKQINIIKKLVNNVAKHTKFEE